jgi:hypothetical protein
VNTLITPLHVGKNFTTQQREIILKYKSLHLQQQANERKKLDENRLDCINKTGDGGQPEQALLFSGMMQFANNYHLF